MHKFYKVKVTRFGPLGLVITTAFQKVGGYYGEVFCVFPDPHSGQEFKIIKADRMLFASAPIAMTEEFMLEEALGQARVDFVQHIQDKYVGKEFLLSPGDLGFDLIDFNYLVHLWVRGDGDFLLNIQYKTNCDDLRGVLLPILKMPKLTRNVIGEGLIFL